jgi:hypothetical protein
MSRISKSLKQSSGHDGNVTPVSGVKPSLHESPLVPQLKAFGHARRSWHTPPRRQEGGVNGRGRCVRPLMERLQGLQPPLRSQGLGAGTVAVNHGAIP